MRVSSSCAGPGPSTPRGRGHGCVVFYSFCVCVGYVMGNCKLEVKARVRALPVAGVAVADEVLHGGSGGRQLCVFV